MKFSNKNKQYKGWNMKTSHFNPHDIVLKAIDNYVPMVADKTNQYVIILPPKTIKGCNSMKVTFDQKNGNLHLELNMDKIYAKDNLSLDYVLKTMKDFVAKEIIPSTKDFYEIETDININNYKDLVKTLIDDKKIINKLNNCFSNPQKYYNENKQDYNKRGITNDDNEKIMWFAIIDTLLNNKLAIEIDYKEEPEEFIQELNTIIKKQELTVNEKIFSTIELTKCFKQINKKWKEQNYILSCIDINSDSYILTILTTEQLETVKTLSNNIGRKISEA